MGPELIVNGDFANGLTGWNHLSVSVVAGRCKFTTDSSQIFEEDDILILGKTYRVSFLYQFSGGVGNFTFFTNTPFETTLAGADSDVHRYVGEFTITQAFLDDYFGLLFDISNQDTADLYIDNVSVREVIEDRLPAYSTSLVTAVARTKQGLGAPEFFLGAQSEVNEYALFRKSTTYFFSLLRTAVRKINYPFGIEEIRLSLHAPLAAGMELTPVLHFDRDSRNAVGTPINTDNYEVGKQFFKLGPANFGFAVRGTKDYYLELLSTGTVLTGVKLPIFIDEDIDNEQ